MLFSDPLKLESNVKITVRNKCGAVVEEHEGHNIFLNVGRTWVRDLIGMGAAAYPNPVAAGSADQNMSSDAGQSGNADTLAIGGKTYRVRFIGVGIGGIQQSITPPGPGTQEEVATITSLETPVQVVNPGAAQWLKEVLPQDDPTDTQIFPDNFKIRFRAIFGYNDISFVAQPTYGLSVPCTEIGLFTSLAGRDVDPAVVVPGSEGMIAYHVFDPISKTPNFVWEVAWELRS